MKNYILFFSLLVVDFTVLLFLFYATPYLYAVFLDESYRSVLQNFNCENFCFILLIEIIFLIYEKIYRFRYDFWQETYMVYKALFYSYGLVLALLTLADKTTEQSLFIISFYFLLVFLFLPVSKRYTKKILYNYPFFRKKVLLAGAGKQKTLFEKEFLKNWYLGIEKVKVNYEAVILFSSDYDVEKLNKTITHYLSQNREVFIVPYVTEFSFANSPILEYSNIRLNTICTENKLLLKRNIYLKRFLDVSLALIILPFYALLHPVLLFMIQRDSKGDVFFKQKRLGEYGRHFVCYKYRTMYSKQQEILQKYLQEHPEEKEYYEKYHKYKNDPRITKIGSFLRQSSLDELAQIINVLKGEMSFIGPRPYMLNEEELLGDAKEMILKVKPGITGLWQVSGRNELSFKERIELDVWYINNWSLWQDIIILIKTLKVVFLKIGAK